MFSACAEDTHSAILRNHVVLMRMQMTGKLWEMALDELLVKMFYWGGRVVKGRVSRTPSFAEWRFWGTRVGWHMAKSEGNTSSLMCLLLLVLIHGI